MGSKVGFGNNPNSDKSYHDRQIRRKMYLSHHPEEC